MALSSWRHKKARKPYVLMIHPWQVVSVPYCGTDACRGAGCRNYQGVAWYRKHFVIPQDERKRVSPSFEGYGKTGDLFKWQEGARALGRIPSFHCATDGTGGTARRQLLAGMMTDNK